MKFRILQWVGYMVRMDNSRILKKVLGGNFPWKKTCGKTTTEMGRQHQEELLVAAAYTSMEEIKKDRDIWRRNVEERPGRDAGCLAIEEEEVLMG